MPESCAHHGTVARWAGYAPHIRHRGPIASGLCALGPVLRAAVPEDPGNTQMCDTGIASATTDPVDTELSRDMAACRKKNNQPAGCVDLQTPIDLQLERTPACCCWPW